MHEGLGEAVRARIARETTEELTLFGTMLRLEINGEPVETGSLPEIRAAVAELVTGWLADDPEGLAVDAQTCNMAFNTGAVQEALDLRGEWYTVVGMHSDHATMRVRIVKEG
ncbi:hypothetical protein [Streptomyces sp. NRRL S-146]|uniref:hypothetical protein n=1 Tax=Streptomyces sp. NRRL S-146 TaxID=1463884 RepID=UPI00131B6731|nr:hypothetical protein [Streptomyces sp. NRRL S-146]